MSITCQCGGWFGCKEEPIGECSFCGKPFWYLFTAFRGGAVTPVNRQEVGLKFDAKPCILKAS